MKPPMPDPLHLEEFGELSRKVAKMEEENRELKREIKWLLRADCIGPTTTERLVKRYNLDNGQ